MKRYLIIVILSLLPSLLSASARHLPVDSLVMLGTDYYRAERYMDALEILGEAMDQADQTGNELAYMRAILTIGNTYTIFDDYDQALHYYELCLRKAAALKNDSIASKVKANMLLCYAMLGKEQEAEACYRSIGTLRMGNVDQNRFYTYVNQAFLAKARKYYKGAIYFHTQAMKYAANHNMNGRYVAAEMGQIGTAYEESGDLKAAEEWYLRCKAYAERGHFVGPLTSACERLAALYRKEGKADLSVRYNKQFVQLSDSFFQQREFNSKRSLISSYEDRLSDRRLSLLKGQNTALLWVVVTIATLLLLLAVLLIYIYRVNRRLVNTQRLLIQKHQEHSHQLQMQNEIFSSIEHVQTEQTEQAEAVPTTVETENEETSMLVSPENTDGSDASADDDLLTKTQADLLLVAIAHVMEDSRVVCNPDFSLSTLAQMVNSNTKYVSWVINKNYGKNFKTYLNEYRIRTASQLLADTEQFANTTIAAVAERVGYKSPASFHQAFKKIYGMTPAAYVKLARQNIVHQDT